jgi:hypothetical protein
LAERGGFPGRFSLVMHGTSTQFLKNGGRAPRPHIVSAALPGPADFHLRARAEAEDAVHSRRIAGLVVALLLLLSAAYAAFVWQSDRSATRLQQPVASYDTPMPSPPPALRQRGFNDQ